MTTTTQGINDIQGKSLMMPAPRPETQRGKGLGRIKAVPPNRKGPPAGSSVTAAPLKIIFNFNYVYLRRRVYACVNLGTHRDQKTASDTLEMGF